MSIEIEVVCDECGAALDASFSQSTGYRVDPKLVVCNCENCIEKAKDEAHAEGYEEATQEYET